jgi:hypothetical protein
MRQFSFSLRKKVVFMEWIAVIVDEADDDDEGGGEQ